MSRTLIETPRKPKYQANSPPCRWYIYAAKRHQDGTPNSLLIRLPEASVNRPSFSLRTYSLRRTCLVRVVGSRTKFLLTLNIEIAERSPPNVPSENLATIGFASLTFGLENGPGC
jgi:hypothetical protein